MNNTPRVSWTYAVGAVGLLMALYAVQNYLSARMANELFDVVVAGMRQAREIVTPEQVNEFPISPRVVRHRPADECSTHEGIRPYLVNFKGVRVVETEPFQRF